MCEVLFFIRDRVAADPYIDAKCYKRGFVISVKPNGWPWSDAELSNPDWRILKIPSVTVQQAQSFVTPEIPVDPAKPSRVLQRRGFAFDVDHPSHGPQFKAWLDDDARAQKTLAINHNVGQLMSLLKKIPVRTDPNVMHGENHNVL